MFKLILSFFYALDGRRLNVASPLDTQRGVTKLCTIDNIPPQFKKSLGIRKFVESFMNLGIKK